jgi:hypothetical protein
LGLAGLQVFSPPEELARFRIAAQRALVVIGVALTSSFRPVPSRRHRNRPIGGNKKLVITGPYCFTQSMYLSLVRELGVALWAGTLPMYAVP